MVRRNHTLEVGKQGEPATDFLGQRTCAPPQVRRHTPELGDVMRGRPSVTVVRPRFAEVRGDARVSMEEVTTSSAARPLVSGW